MDRNTSFLAATALAAAAFGMPVQAADPAVLPTDPPRWSVPAETPAQKHAVAMQEAGAALNEALKECRAVQPAAVDRKACESEAREVWKREVSLARRHLSNDNSTPR